MNRAIFKYHLHNTENSLFLQVYFLQLLKCIVIVRKKFIYKMFVSQFKSQVLKKNSQTCARYSILRIILNEKLKGERTLKNG